MLQAASSSSSVTWTTPSSFRDGADVTRQYRRPPVSEQQREVPSRDGPLAGVRVVELGLWLAAPTCATILADWGADVVKVEPLDGDPFRGLAWAYGGQMNPPFELDNRGKRSVAVDLRTGGGQEVLETLLSDADLFVTNYRPGGLERLGLDWPTVHARHPRPIYGSITGYGLDGPERDRASYDMGAYWGRAGVAAALTPPGQDLPYQRGGFGDHLTGMSLAGGLSAALFARQRTGVGQLVSTSLLHAGMYQMGADINTSLRTGWPTLAASVRSAPNPLLTGYRCANEEWIWLLGLEGDRHWPNVAAALELDHLHDNRGSRPWRAGGTTPSRSPPRCRSRFGSDSRPRGGGASMPQACRGRRCSTARGSSTTNRRPHGWRLRRRPCQRRQRGPDRGHAGRFSGRSRFAERATRDLARTPSSSCSARLGVGAHRHARAGRRHHLTSARRSGSGACLTHGARVRDVACWRVARARRHARRRAPAVDAVGGPGVSTSSTSSSRPSSTACASAHGRSTR